MNNDLNLIKAQYLCDKYQAVDYGDGDYYTYIHFRNDNGEPFYVGKGSRNDANKYDRVKMKKRQKNDHWQSVVNKAGYTVKVIRNCGANEQLSLDYETELVALFRSIGFNMTNKTNGGEGTSGCPLSDEAKQKLSLSISGEKHYMWGKTHNDATKQKMSLAKLGTKRNNTRNVGKSCKIIKGYAIGFNEDKVIIFCGEKDIKNRGFNSSRISQMIFNNPNFKSTKGYTSFIRTFDKNEVIELLKTRSFADTQSEEHFNNM